MYYSLSDFDELAKLADEAKPFFPSDPEMAVEYFAQFHSHLLACLIVTNVWAYLEAEVLIQTGRRTDPFLASRKWRPTDVLNYIKTLRN